MFERMAQHLADYVNEVRNFDVEIKQSDFPERAYYEA
jgi:hypothetical protein